MTDHIKFPRIVIQDANGDTWLVPVDDLKINGAPLALPEIGNAKRSDAPLLRNASVCERVFTDMNRDPSPEQQKFTDSFMENLKRQDEERAANMKRIDEESKAEQERIDQEFRIGGILLFLGGWAILSLYFAAMPTLAWWQGIIAGGIFLAGCLLALKAISWAGGKLTSVIATWHLNRKARKEAAA